MRALYPLLMHPQISRVHGEIVARGARTDHHHAAALHTQDGDRKSGGAGMLKHEVDVVALTRDLPNAGAEFARLLEPGFVFRGADLRQLAPTLELLAIDDTACAELHDKIALLLVGDDADRVGTGGGDELHRH